MSQAGRNTRSSAGSSSSAAAVAATAEEKDDKEEENNEDELSSSAAVAETTAATTTEATTSTTTTTTTTTVMEQTETSSAQLPSATAETTATATCRKRKAEELSTASIIDDETNNDNDYDNDKKEEESTNKKMKQVEPEAVAAEEVAAAAAAAAAATEKESVAKTDEPVKDTESTTAAVVDAVISTDGKKEAEAESSVATPATATAAATNEATSTASLPSNEETEKTETKKAAEEERTKNPYDSLKYILVRNDGKPESMIKLVGLKSLFAKQLPKMPRAYIARLVFDPRHTSLAILSENPRVKDSDDEIIGAICYRAFDDMRFAEIAFCAVNATHQVKGYGTKLMTLLKKIGAEQQPVPIEYFITYADNYAIGYFKKQGFSKSIQMPRGRYFGLIKEYDGGTPMECYVHPSCDFTRVPEMLEAQRNFILSRIEQVAMSKTIYPPIGQLKDDSNSLTAYNTFASSVAAAGNNGGGGGSTTSVAALVAASANGGVGGGSAATAGSRGNQSAARAMAVPGMEQAGWTMSDLMAAMGQGKESDRQKTALKTEFLAMIRKIEEQHFAWPFREPVDTNEVPDYLDVIKEPIDLSTIDKRIRQDNHYKSKQMLYQDLMLMVNNCKLYNEPASPYAQCASSLETYLGQLFRKEDIAGRG